MSAKIDENKKQTIKTVFLIFGELWKRKNDQIIELVLNDCLATLKNCYLRITIKYIQISATKFEKFFLKNPIKSIHKGGLDKIQPQNYWKIEFELRNITYKIENLTFWKNTLEALLKIVSSRILKNRLFGKTHWKHP